MSDERGSGIGERGAGSGDRGSGIGDQGAGIGDRGSALDRAIDGAVREMLDVEPPAGLRAQVLNRIAPVASGFIRKDLLSRNDRFRRKIIWTAVPLAAAATLILALVLPSKHAERPPLRQPPSTTAAVEPSRMPAPIAPPGASAPLRTPGATTASRVVRRPRTRTAAVRDGIVAAAAFTPAEPAASIEPLSITPIEVAPIAQQRIAPSDISVRPLNPITELQIAPLNPSERRN
jgi:hypothetical protein